MQRRLPARWVYSKSNKSSLLLVSKEGPCAPLIEFVTQYYLIIKVIVLMRNTDKYVVRLRLIYCVAFSLLFYLALFVIPDYVRAQECTEKTYAVVTEKEVNTILGIKTSYDYTLQAEIGNRTHIFPIRNCNVQCSIGDIVLVKYTPNKTLWRIPNELY